MQTALFNYGFRPFFLAAGLAAALILPWWAGSVALGWQLSTGWPPMLWHGHEMLFGFIGAAIAGFLLTAVPNWTGERGFAGRPLVALSALWFLARLLIVTSAAWPAWLVGTADVAFLPALAAFVAVPLLRSRNRNTPLLAVLLALAACNGVFHFALATHAAPLASRSLLVAIDIVLVLVTVIAGRLVPAFTAAALRQAGSAVTVRAWPYVGPVAIALTALNAIADLLGQGGWPVALIAAGAALAHLARLAQWRSFATARQPIVWVLHVAYAWLPVGFALKALAAVAGSASAAFWLHAFTVGGVTTMIVAVMTRASLGHTGRPLVVAPAIAVAYGLLTAAAVVRVFALGVTGMGYPAVIVVSALFFTAAFVLYLAIYAPILCRARLDGRPG